MKLFSPFLVLSILVLLVLFSCQNDEKITEESKQNPKPELVIDSSAFKVKKNQIKDFTIKEEKKISSKLEINKLVATIDENALTEYQKFIQSFLKDCAAKNYNSASQKIAYKGKDTSRNAKDSYDLNNPKEMKIVYSTVDVIFDFLEESKNYQFNKKAGKEEKNVEVSFFKHEIGINRRFFEVQKTKDSFLIVSMK